MRRLLIANRGEIARRVIRTAHAMGIETVAVHSDADAESLHVREAALSHALRGVSAAETYLRVDRLIEAARATRADAVHPGYGFLSENADFAQAVIDAGLVWVGPPPQAIRTLGSKSRAKQLALQCGVPCLPGYQGDDASDERLMSEAQRLGLPLMVKAVAGGGGRGMRLVSAMPQLAAALASARSEAQASFGCADLLIERALLAPRHVEVQIFADAHGHCIHLGERDCSVQRRYQKIIEETPSPAVDAALRERMGRCAVELAQAAGYVGAGTVEFLLDDSARLSLASGNPGTSRHPLAAGNPGTSRHPLADRNPGTSRHSLADGNPDTSRHPLAAGNPGTSRHSRASGNPGDSFYFMEINTRLQVEHPITEAVTGLDLVEWQLRIARGETLPLTQEEVKFEGHAIEARLCAEDDEFRPQSGRVMHFRPPHGVRFDHALFAGMDVSPHYDSMLGKLIAHAASRDEAIDRLAAALDATQILGLATNRRFLAACLRHEQFRRGEALIPFLAQQGDTIRASLREEEAQRIRDAALAALCPPAPPLASPFTRPLRIRHREAVIDLPVREPAEPPRASVAALGGRRFHVQLGSLDVFVEDASFDPPASASQTSAADELRAPFNGKVIAVKAEPGRVVVKGEPLVILESMKLEHALAAERDGIVRAIHVEPGQQAAAWQVLVTLEQAG
ncbi:MAG TPA: biotin carboxylase N-terminal domain-containing protein [Ramlibacter sp.]|uniref:acetyl/propionyl/methylcrotonyl-CoA carboxylase subunit alpha n=1 Tax=Ramlibacter sp. TaxID=1917967 RepID=UPI002CE6D8AC|nr:biotin carboxylase N-terminal domain-containing protein [Ramlibacter sp.]HVZ44993.1 biotin carboxylase N-terminal domain-containing protein [Ramlibacter sp.]